MRSSRKLAPRPGSAGKKYNSPLLEAALALVAGGLLLYLALDVPAPVWLFIKYGARALRGGSLEAGVRSLQTALLGLSMAAFCAAVAWGLWKAKGAAPSSRIILLAGLGVLLAALLPALIHACSGVTGGRRIWFLCDDEMISMRYAQNLAHGHGLVWNPGERVEGYSNLLWTLGMAGIQLLGFSPGTASLPVLLLNILIACAVAWALAALALRMGLGSWGLLACLAALVMNVEFLGNTLSGGEFTLMALLATLAWCLIWKKDGPGGPSWAAAALAGLMPLVRADGIVPAALLAGAAFWIFPWRKSLKMALAPALALALSLAFRLFYYGEWIPNSAQLKVLNFEGRFPLGAAYLLEYLKAYLPLAAAAVAGWWLKPDPRKAAGLFFMGGMLFYIAGVGGDPYPGHRFMIPFLPLLLAMGFDGLKALLPAPRGFLGACTCCLLLTPLIFPGFNLGQDGAAAAGLQNARLGLLIAQNTPPSARVGLFMAGSLSYFSDRPGVDFLGINDKVVARLPARGVVAGHNKYDLDYSLDVCKPDLVVSERIPVDEAARLMGRESGGPVKALLALNLHPRFLEDYLPNQVQAGGRPQDIYVRKGSALLKQGLQWRE